MAPLAPLRTLPSTERLELRPHDERDLELIRVASQDPLIPRLTSVPVEWSNAAGRAFIARQADRPLQGLGWSLAIVDRASAEAVGNVFVTLLGLPLGCAEIGYWIAAPHRRSGLAAETLRLTSEWVTEEFGVRRVSVYVDPENTASRRTAAAAGFIEEETLSHGYQLDGAWRPMIRHGRADQVALGDIARVGRLETRMWLNGYRDDREWFDHFLHDDFVEFGRSGRLWTRDAIIAQQVGEIEVDLPLTDLSVVEIAEATMLVTYRSRQPRGDSHRSSLWLRTEPGEWKLRFHQCTPTERTE